MSEYQIFAAKQASQGRRIPHSAQFGMPPHRMDRLTIAQHGAGSDHPGTGDHKDDAGHDSFATAAAVIGFHSRPEQRSRNDITRHPFQRPGAFLGCCRRPWTRCSNAAPSRPAKLGLSPHAAANDRNSGRTHGPRRPRAWRQRLDRDYPAANRPIRQSDERSPVDPHRSRNAPPRNPHTEPRWRHGFFSLSLISSLLRHLVRLRGDFQRLINYGLNKVRFPSPVPAGARIRGRFRLQSVRELEDGVQMIWLVLNRT